MDLEPDWDEIPKRFRIYGIWAASGLIDTIFLVLWVLAQWVASWLISHFELVGVDLVVKSIFQLIFAVSTVVPIVIHTYADIRIMIIQMKRRIERETDPEE